MISDWDLERAAADGLSDAEREALQRRIDADPDAAARFAGLAASTAEILERYPPANVVAALERRRRVLEAQRSAARPPRRAGWWWTAPVIAAAAVFLLVVKPAPDSGLGVGDGTRLKGPAQLVIFRQRGDHQVQLLPPEAVVHAGDRLQVGYLPGTDSYGVILSMDGRGHVTHHWPETARAGFLGGGQLRLLDYSWELDAAPRFERFFFITSPEPFATATAIDAVQQLGDAEVDHPDLPPPLHQSSFLIRKAP